MKIFTIFQNKQARKVIVFLLWIGIWEALCLFVGNTILLASPVEVLKELLNQMQEMDFYQSVLFSLVRIMSGFILGLVAGILLGMTAFFKSLIMEVLAPIVTLLKSIPIASFVVLLLIWMGSKYLSIWIAFLVVFPNVYLHTIMGLMHTDQKLLEMASVFSMSRMQKLSYLYIPAMLPFLISSVEVSIGMSFKSGVAAEVIGTPAFSFGEKLYLSKIQLNTAGVFAWTIVIILVSFAMEKLFLFLIKQLKEVHLLNKRIRRYQKKSIQIDNDDSEGEIVIDNLSKRYEEKVIFDKLSLRLKKGGIYCMMGPSGSGKTTFFQILLGLIKKEEGKIEGVTKGRVAAVFQDVRLLEEQEAIDNAFLFHTLSKGNVWEEEEYKRLLPKESMHKLVKELSGGMQRRVAILRAMNYDASLVILDEPFSGLDERTKKIVASYIREKKGNKTLLVATHNKEDVSLLKGEIIDGNESGFNWNYGRRP